MKSHTITFFFSVVFIYLLTSSCTSQKEKYPEIDIGDGGLLSSLPCSAPCFWNITPGMTSEVDAITILSSLGKINECDDWDKSENGIEKGIGCANLDIYFNDKSIVSQLVFKPSQIISVSEILSKYGEPDTIIVLAEGTELDGPINMTLLFNKVNMAISLPTQGINYFDLEPTTIIDGVQYCDESTYKRNINVLNEPWKGYGKYY